jgi:NAD(P)-dependent dehydrogenase (short-subunit alcohol dehydrogenase family)
MFVNKGESGAFLAMTARGGTPTCARTWGFSSPTKRAAHGPARRAGSHQHQQQRANRVHRNLIAYDSVKGAIDTFTRAVAVDLAPWGIQGALAQA